MSYKNPYIRLQTYYNWLINDQNEVAVDDNFELGMSISRLHEITNIPLKIIRHDMYALFQWKHSLEKNTLYKLKLDEKGFRLNWKTDIEFADMSPENKIQHLPNDLNELYFHLSENDSLDGLEKLFLQGILDDVPIHIRSDTSQKYQISITPEEAAALHSYCPNESKYAATYTRFSQKYLGKYYIKDSFRSNHQYVDLNNKLDIINQAINEKICLQMRYRTAKNKIIHLCFQPLKIAFDSTENLYAVISIDQNRVNVHRLDHILSIEESRQKLQPPDLSLLDIAPNVWGCCFSDPPVHVKIKFYNEANVWEKVKKDLAYRTNGKLYEKDNFLYYEDTVYGISKLRPWLYGYGSSAIVLEPKSLRQYIIENLKERFNKMG